MWRNEELHGSWLSAIDDCEEKKSLMCHCSLPFSVHRWRIRHLFRVWHTLAKKCRSSPQNSGSSALFRAVRTVVLPRIELAYALLVEVFDWQPVRYLPSVSYLRSTPSLPLTCIYFPLLDCHRNHDSPFPPTWEKNTKSGLWFFCCLWKQK